VEEPKDEPCFLDLPERWIVSADGTETTDSVSVQVRLRATNHFYDGA
jgi:hypothetical protein